MTHSIKINNGPTILVEPMPHLHSVSTGIWAKAGSAAETPELSGVSHFLEHMLFKGTEKRSALDIAAAMESLGGVLNAFTGKEYTCYYTRSLDEHFEQSVELLADMYAHSLLDPDE
ncbi:MAG: insulinase family protein, partial [Clostridiales bacterium]